MEGRHVIRISPQIKEYAWGSHEALARLAGCDEPSVNPEAELWVGAHEAGPARLPDGTTLDALIASDPSGQLGAEVAQQFDGRLPFLLKILAAEKALSIQVHPGSERASSAPEGTYPDTWPKPEAWVPLTDCVAFVGSLPYEVVAPELLALDVPALTALVERAGAAPRPAHELLAQILAVPASEQGRFVTDVLDAVASAVRGSDLPPQRREAWRTTLDVAAQFPGDIGAIVTLTMEHLKLTPGQSYFIDAGVLHSFVRGTTVEVLANSDNVVRAGLTPKDINVAELLTIVDVDARVTASAPQRVGNVAFFESPVPHFRLLEVTPAASASDSGSGGDPLPLAGQPAVVLALGGEVTLTSSTDQLTLQPREAAWIPAGSAAVTVTGQQSSRLFVASVNA